MKNVCLIGILCAALATAGCGGINVNLFVVGEQTSLEKQVLGSYAALGEDILLYSSVRAVDEEGNLKPPPEMTESQRAAVQAMRNREYNRDDITRLLANGVVGETNDGMLERRDLSVEIAGLDQSEREQVITEENNDRRALVERLLETSNVDTDEDRAEVRWLFATLNQDRAPDGAWIQTRGGGWTRK